MIDIQTRGNFRGAFWCNCTYNGRDYSVEAESVRKARKMILAETGLHRNQVRFEKTKRFVPPSKEEPFVGYSRSRIDNL